MVDSKSVEKQLKALRFNPHGWGTSEVKELPNILLPDEKIFELANGIYEGGFALLVATDVRVILVDKKPLNYLTVEDLRFDMINEIDYSHRLFGAQISIATGSKNLKFRSYNQPRLRKLIGHVQHCMADSKRVQNTHQEDQKQHLERINEQLQAYLMAQHQHQLKLQKQLNEKQQGKEEPETAQSDTVKPSPELSDYLFAQTLLQQYKTEHPDAKDVEPQALPEELAHSFQSAPTPPVPLPEAPKTAQNVQATGAGFDSASLYAEGVQEIFGKHKATTQPSQPAQQQASGQVSTASHSHHNPLEINPLRIAYSKLPMALRNRKFGRPSFHAHSQHEQAPQPAPAQT